MSGSVLLHLMRHGEPVSPGRMLGRTDAPVSAEGITACLRQAEALGVDRIVSSDLTRARDCAVAIGVAKVIAPTVDARWREMDFGDWDGLLPAQVDPVALARFWGDPDNAPPPGGERWMDLTTRVRAALGSIGAETTLVVTHGGAIRAALAALCGFDLRQVWAFDLPCAAVISLRIWPDTAQITALRP